MKYIEELVMKDQRDDSNAVDIPVKYEDERCLMINKSYFFINFFTKTGLINKNRSIRLSNFSVHTRSLIIVPTNFHALFMRWF